METHIEMKANKKAFVTDVDGKVGDKVESHWIECNGGILYS